MTRSATAVLPMQVLTIIVPRRFPARGDAAEPLDGGCEFGLGDLQWQRAQEIADRRRERDPMALAVLLAALHRLGVERQVLRSPRRPRRACRSGAIRSFSFASLPPRPPCACSDLNIRIDGLARKTKRAPFLPHTNAADAVAS